MDLCLLARNTGVGPAEVAGAVGLGVEQVERVFRDIDQKRASTEYLHLRPAMAAHVAEVGDR
jgi:NAD+ synthase